MGHIFLIEGRVVASVQEADENLGCAGLLALQLQGYR